MSDLVPLELDDQLWERVFVVSPIALIGTRDEDGGHDIAPKHRVVALSPLHFGFVCRPSHATYRNALRERAFTVSWPGPQQIVKASAAASPRCEDGEKTALRGISTLDAKQVDGVLVEGSRFHLECELDRVVEDFGEESLVIGNIVAAHAAKGALRGDSQRDDRLVHDQPLLAYLHPSQFALVDHSTAFPFPKNFTRD